MPRSYLDHASTSPLRPSARDAMIEALNDPQSGIGADPSRIHDEGMWARQALENARATIGELLNVTPRSVVFTSGATESIATAIHFGRARGAHAITSAVEHSAVTKGLADGPHDVVGVDSHGLISTADVQQTIRPETSMAHIQWVNHETGVIQPIKELVATCHEAGTAIHVDAAQAIGNVPADLTQLGADLVSISAHKFGGPAGIGALIVRKGLRLDPLLLGGEQERLRRAGLENLLGALGFAAALCEATADMDDRIRRYQQFSLAVRAWASETDGVHAITEPGVTSPHIVSLTIAGVEPQGVLLGLDQRGVAVHSGSACAAEDLQPSTVLAAMGVDAHHSLRISFGHTTTETDIDRLLTAIGQAISYLRSIGT